MIYTSSIPWIPSIFHDPSIVVSINKRRKFEYEWNAGNGMDDCSDDIKKIWGWAQSKRDQQQQIAIDSILPTSSKKKHWEEYWSI